MLIEWITCFAIRSIQAWRYGSLDLHQVVASTLAVPGNEGVGLRLGVTHGSDER
jgi:hypothetical protein